MGGAVRAKNMPIWEKASPAESAAWLLRRQWATRQEPGRASDVRAHFLRHKRSGYVVPLDGCEWADWDGNDDLLFAKGGGLYRLALTDLDGTPTVSDARLLVDLSGERFRNLAAPEAAKDWFADVPLDEALRIT